MKHPPGPSGLPLLGSLLRARRDPLCYAMDLARQYGDIARFRVGKYSGYLINHPDYYRHVLVARQANYDKDNYNYRKLRPVLGDGLITSDGEQWRRSRKIIQPAFHAGQIGQFKANIARATREMMHRWDDLSTRDQPVAAGEEMMKLAFRLMAESLFSADLQDSVTRVRRAFAVLNRDIARRFMSVWVPPLWVPVPRNLAFRRARDTLDSVVYEMIDRRRSGTGSRGDVLDMLISSADRESGLSNKQIRDEVMTLMLAGHETTANLLAWTLYLLAEHPEIQDQIHEEASSLQSSLNDLSLLQITKCVISEALRLYPPVWIFSRRAIANDEIGEYRIPAGTTVTMCTYALHRHPEFWTEPELFDPHRFAVDNGGIKSHPAYFPFGAGPRTCLGGHLAMTEAQIIVALICRRFRFKIIPGQHLEPQPYVTLRPRREVKLILHRR